MRIFLFSYLFNLLILKEIQIPSNNSYTAGGIKSDRNGFTKMRVTALIIVRLPQFFLTQSLKYIETLLKKSKKLHNN